MTTKPEYLLTFQRDLLDSVLMSYEELLRGRNSQGLILMGSSGVGKTHGLDVLASNFLDWVQREPWAATAGIQPISPVLRYAADAKADANSMLTHLLARLGKVVLKEKRPGLGKLEADFLQAMHARRVRLLILEEFHNAILKGTPQLRGQAARLLKNIWNMAPEDSSLGWSKPAPGRDDWRVIIVVSGTEELLPVFDKDAELSSRFSTIVRAQQLGFTPPAAFKEFRGVLKHMVAHEELTGWLVANDNDLAARIMLACNGHLRLLEKLLQRTATLWNKAGKNRDLPPLALLAQAFPAINSSGATNPFELAPEELQNRVASALRQSNNQHKDWS